MDGDMAPSDGGAPNVPFPGDPGILVSRHAQRRWLQRIDAGVSLTEAAEALSGLLRDVMGQPHWRKMVFTPQWMSSGSAMTVTLRNGAPVVITAVRHESGQEGWAVVVKTCLPPKRPVRAAPAAHGVKQESRMKADRTAHSRPLATLGDSWPDAPAGAADEDPDAPEPPVSADLQLRRAVWLAVGRMGARRFAAVDVLAMDEAAGAAAGYGKLFKELLRMERQGLLRRHGPANASAEPNPGNCSFSVCS